MTGAPAPRRIAVVGAGVAGLSAAQALAARGHAVTVFDKGRGPGGRLSTRRRGGFQFDHGAQYFTLRDEGFAAEVRSWEATGVAARWYPRLVALHARALAPRGDADDAPREAGGSVQRWVGVPGMNAVARHLARGLDVRAATRITAATREGATWTLADEQGAVLTGVDDLVLAVPPINAVALLDEVPALRVRVEAVRMLPCWAVLAAFDRPVPAGFDAAFGVGALSWVARDTSKPGRDADVDAWVLHGSPAWSAAHLEDSPEDVAPALLDAFADAARVTLPGRRHVEAHRWRYALAESALDAGALADADARVVVCGDWCAGSRVEGAWLSGRAAADALSR